MCIPHFYHSLAHSLTHSLIESHTRTHQVLLNRDDQRVLRGKVADFGLSKIFGTKNDSLASSSTTQIIDSEDETKQNQSSFGKDSSWSSTSSSHTTGVGSTFWMAPELVVAIREDRGAYTPKVDIYAFGIIMHELLVLLRPYSDRDVTFSYKILNAVEKGERPLVTPQSRAKAPEKYCKLMEDCWHQDATKRPEFNTVFHRLSKMLSVVMKNSSSGRGGNMTGGVVDDNV